MTTTGQQATVSGLAEHHRRAIASTRGFISAITPDQWSLATPCAEWNVRELVNHVIVGNLWAAELADGRTIADVGDRLGGDHTGEDPLGAYDVSARAAVTAFDADGVLVAPCAVSYGPVPGEVYLGHRFIDVLVHGWDLAVATGQPADLDPELVAACWAVVEPQLAELQSSGAFGTVPGPSGVGGAAERLLAALGRQSSN